MKGVKSLINAIIFLLMISVMKNSYAVEKYVVKPGDTLSDVLIGLNIKPVYGVNGSLNKILKLNPDLQKKHGNYIIPGQSISLFELMAPQTRSVSSTLSTPVDTIIPPVVTPSCSAPVEENTKSESFLLLSMDRNQTEIKGSADNGTTGNLHSSKASGLNLEWSPRYSRFHWIGFGYKHSSLEFNDSSQRNLSGKSQSLDGFYLTSHYEWSDQFSSDFRLGSQERLFYRSTSLTDIKIEKMPLYYSQISFQYNLAELNNITYAVKLDGRVHLPNSNDYYSVKTSFGHTINFLAEQKLKRFTLFANGHYSKDSFDAKEIEYLSEDVGVNFGIKIRIGD